MDLFYRYMYWGQPVSQPACHFSILQVGHRAYETTWTAIEAGLAYLPGTIVMLFVSGATSVVFATVPARVMVGGGLLLVAGGMVLFTLAGVSSSWTIILPGAFVALIGTGLFNPALTAVALGSAPAEQSGLAAGVNDTFRQAGIAVGVAALGALVPASAALGGGEPQAYVDGLHDALLVGAGLAAVGAVAAAVLIPKAFVTTPPVEDAPDADLVLDVDEKVLVAA